MRFSPGEILTRVGLPTYRRKLFSERNRLRAWQRWRDARRGLEWLSLGASAMYWCSSEYYSELLRRWFVTLRDTPTTKGRRAISRLDAWWLSKRLHHGASDEGQKEGGR